MWFLRILTHTHAEGECFVRTDTKFSSALSKNFPKKPFSSAIIFRPPARLDEEIPRRPEAGAEEIIRRCLQ
jgi:hypothetical protein